MRIDWQIKTSRISTISIIFLSMTPIIISISISLQQSLQLIVLVILLSLLMLFLLYRNTNLTSQYSIKQLAWEDGQWSYSNKEIIFSGVQSKHSFSLGLFMFLSIESENGKRIGLWLFPDNILSNLENIESKLMNPRQTGWHHLHCCFYLPN